MAPQGGSVPPPLPPSVEEAYRRKCIQLKQRLNETEESNDAARARLSRQHRAIDKLRLERAFLLEQLAKRTSTNVEDSEGSPSPPPTPKEKPLRNKRGHRKPEYLTNTDSIAGSTFIQQGGPATLSPSGSAFSHNEPQLPISQLLPNKRPLPSSNGQASFPANHSATPPLLKPKNAYEVYADELRSVMLVQNREAYAKGTSNPDNDLARGWREMDDGRKEEYQRRYDAMKNPEKDSAGNGAEDVEMGDGEERDEHEVAETGSFTAVNRE